MKGALPVLLVAALLVGGIVYFAGSRDGSRSHADAERSTPDEAVTPPAPPTDRPAASTIDEQIDSLLASEDASANQAVAAALRRMLRMDPAARQRAVERLLSDDLQRERRMALALVLGTLPGSDVALREALARFGDDAAVARCLVFALGATREPLDDDDVFALGDQPWGAHGPGGLGITVRRPIEDPATRNAVGKALADSRGPVREAAAIALRHSMRWPEARSEFVAAVRTEASDDVALVLGEALAVWAGGTREGSDRTEVVRTLLARVGEPGLDGFRFRMEDDFRRIALDEAHQATLLEYASPARPYAVRSFALTALAAGAAAQARTAIESYAASDPDAAVRDLCARLLGTLPQNDGTIRVLATASLEDAAWNVRYQAVDALARFPQNKTAVAALKAATADPDPRVAKRARAAVN